MTKKESDQLGNKKKRRSSSGKLEKGLKKVCKESRAAHRFSVVLKSSRELRELMFLGRLPRPSSASSSWWILVLTHRGKYLSFSCKRTDTGWQDTKGTATAAALPSHPIHTAGSTAGAGDPAASFPPPKTTAGAL